MWLAQVAQLYRGVRRVGIFCAVFYYSKPLFHVIASCFALQRCDGIAAWKYYPWVNWRDGGENKELRRVTYNKTRNDIILRVAFHSTLAQLFNDQCGEWFIKFSGNECTQPAPIVTSLYSTGNQWLTTPTELSGFCNATSTSSISPGPVVISVHVRNCQSSNPNVFTGSHISGLRKPKATSFLVVEEYCL